MQTKDQKEFHCSWPPPGGRTTSAPMVHKPPDPTIKKIHIFEIADQNQ
ncbi:MAG: hypothetical protein IPJ02_15990 [Chitinophagaceae bacterium]|nr:hypothetical protein [Chitinophagaceae bacterium]